MRAALSIYAPACLPCRACIRASADLPLRSPPAQMEALQAGLDGSPVVLIQGPPGTGKTRTILNLLSVVMHAAQRGSLELMRVGGRAAERGERGRRRGASGSRRDL
jgi:hypothetical protein